MYFGVIWYQMLLLPKRNFNIKAVKNKSHIKLMLFYNCLIYNLHCHFYYKARIQYNNSFLCRKFCLNHGHLFYTRVMPSYKYNKVLHSGSESIASVCFISDNSLFDLIFFYIQFALLDIFIHVNPFSAAHIGINCYKLHIDCPCFLTLVTTAATHPLPVVSPSSTCNL